MSARTTAPLQLRRRVEVALEGLAAIAGTLVVGAIGALVFGALALGVLLSVVWIGLPLVIGALGACQTLAEVHRRQANRLLGAHLPPLPEPERRGDSLWRRSLYALSDRRRWRVIALVALDLPVGAALLLAGIAPIALTAELLVLGGGAIGGVGDADFLGPLALTPLTGVLLLVLAAACAVLSIAVLGGLRVAVRSYSRALLGR
ncbi:MAG: sensor domain-containing protein, partial [Solirubrobacteraceae bacterium]